MSESLIVRADLRELARVVDWTEAAGCRLCLQPSTLFAIHLCLEEAISNIIRHGAEVGKDADLRDREVHLNMEQVADQVVLTIEDRGKAFDPFSVPTPAKPGSIEEASAGGWGVHLIRQFAHSHAYQRQDGVNRLTLRFAT